MQNRIQKKKVVVAMSPTKSLCNLSGQSGGGSTKKKVVVAMSGGVDSSVSAALLKQQDFDVFGIFMKLWNSNKKNVQCCSSESEDRARRVAEILEIPFYVLNLEKEFKQKIVDCFLRDYKSGITPNPCVFCNNEIKFGLLMDKALSFGADYIATGHYARLHETSNTRHGTQYRLLKAKDAMKDQSYFLWKLNQKQLKRVLFPVGDYTRQEVEKKAKEMKLPFNGVKKSMEVCFISSTNEEFLKKYLKLKRGSIIDNKTGSKIGEHEGLPLYTIGQRKGIKLSGGPFWVVKKDINKNTLFVTKKEKDLLKNKAKVNDLNWISGEEPKLPLKVRAKIRYQAKDATGKIKYNKKSKFYIMDFDDNQRSVTPGQSIVFYRNDELLGGGIIFI
jgi:tRNA-specific 2-thiouridylase